MLMSVCLCSGILCFHYINVCVVLLLESQAIYFRCIVYISLRPNKIMLMAAG